jgi:hypothetical protein
MPPGRAWGALRSSLDAPRARAVRDESCLITCQRAVHPILSDRRTTRKPFLDGKSDLIVHPEAAEGRRPSRRRTPLGIMADVAAFFLQGRRVPQVRRWLSLSYLWSHGCGASLRGHGFGGDSFPSMFLLEFVPSKRSRRPALESLPKERPQSRGAPKDRDDPAEMSGVEVHWHEDTDAPDLQRQSACDGWLSSPSHRHPPGSARAPAPRPPASAAALPGRPPPGMQLRRQDPMLARHIRHRDTVAKRLQHHRGLHMLRPPPPPCRTRHDLDTTGITFVSAVRTYVSLYIVIHRRLHRDGRHLGRGAPSSNEGGQRPLTCSNRRSGQSPPAG